MAEYITKDRVLKKGDYIKYRFTFGLLSQPRPDEIPEALGQANAILAEVGARIVNHTYRLSITHLNITELFVFVEKENELELTAGQAQDIIEKALEGIAWYVFPQEIYLISEYEATKATEPLDITSFIIFAATALGAFLFLKPFIEKGKIE